MAFNVNEFRNKLTNGGARPSQFEMQITWPDAVRGAGLVSSAERDFRFLCQISEIPASTIGDINIPYFGRKIKVAGDRSFGTLSLQVINDEDFKVHKALNIWSRAMTEHQTVISQFPGGVASGSYATDGIVIQYSRNSGGSPLHAWKYVGMFPTSIGKIDLDWNTTDEIERFTVDFDYQWWEEVDASTGATISVNM